MKKTIFILLVLILCMPLLSQSYIASPKEYVLKTLKKYNPDGYYIIDTYMQAPTTFRSGMAGVTMSRSGYMQYVAGNNKMSILQSLETAVHETCHGYISLLGTGYSYKINNTGYVDKHLAVYVGNKKNIYVKFTKIFKTRKMKHSIPKHLRTLRYSYVKSNNNTLGSQVDGVYGLLDEFCAYYRGLLQKRLLNI